MFWKFFKKTADPSETNPKSSLGTKTTLPLAFLQKLVPVGKLSPEELKALNVSIEHFTPGQIIFNRGENADALMYLYSGNVFLEATNGSGYAVDENTFTAYHPLSSHADHHFTAIAKSAAQIAYLPLSVLQHSNNAALTHNPLFNATAIPPELSDSDFFNAFCAAFRRDELRLPSLPDVAFRLRRALQKDISIADAVKIINLDPVIASKLIQVANSPLYRTVNPISKCHDAINRLGLKATQNLVTSISLHNLFRSNNKLLNNRVQQLWRQSIQIASLSYTLAGMAKKINPDEALLAGLTHNIGALPIITFAESVKNITFTEQELDKTIEVLQDPVGEFILKKWHFPENLVKIPSQSGNWYYNGDPALQMSDIVLLARFHALLGNKQTHKLPPLSTLPAFAKLGEKTLTPDMSLHALQEAKQQISEALSFFRT
ncbi:MAG: HDOD domain-containing protein [Methylomonas sp.]|jgi:HD-like signal output (HDOD) protein|uniref:HDOD domain-containing protein n=1 Tax=Methylomonas sp. TaxID=418 RepID=UPI0025CBE7ED|nr:HDOD domain-containing protein [Methylomonas sp.]MCK9609102.1 HDOD domain-containing protein [Methylomonas sp.]